jgi:hypothetical protein
MASYGAHTSTLDEDTGKPVKKKASEWLRDPSLDAQVNMLQFNGYIGDNPGKGIKQFTGHGPKDDQVQARNPMYFTDILKYIMKKLGDVNVTGFMQAGPAPAMEAELAEAGGGYEKKTASEWLKDPRLETQVEMLQANGYFGDVPGKGIQQLTGHGPKDDQVQARNPMYFKEFLSSIMKKLGDNPITAKIQAGPAPAMEAEIEESPFSWAAKNTPKGEKFSLGGKEFVKNDAFAFEALEKQLNALLESKEEVAEGMTVSISKGQQGAPDTVSVTGTDADAEKVLGLIKQLGLGAFSDKEEMSGYGVASDTENGEDHGGIGVVGDHDGMMGLIKKLSGQDHSDSHNYSDEEEHHEEETCSSCGGMMEAGHSCGSKEMVDETETEDQMTYEVAEDEEVVNNGDEASEEETDSQRDAALAQAAGANFAKVDEDEAEAEAEDAEVELEETYANSTDDDFTAETEFMTNTITSGLNKKKSTGQTTIPVIAGQNDRMGYNTNESLQDWRKLAGIK